jgi:diaminopimelate epimerase
MGRARLRGEGELEADGRTWRYQHIEIGNPQTAIRVPDRGALEALDLPAIGPAIEHHANFPGRTNVSWWTERGSDAIQARIFERGVGETLSSGTGATGAAIAHVLRGGDSPVTVHLDGGELTVDVGEDLHVDLAGWAVPVYTAELDAGFVAALESL